MCSLFHVVPPVKIFFHIRRNISRLRRGGGGTLDAGGWSTGVLDAGGWSGTCRKRSRRVSALSRGRRLRYFASRISSFAPSARDSLDANSIFISVELYPAEELRLSLLWWWLVVGQYHSGFRSPEFRILEWDLMEEVWSPYRLGVASILSPRELAASYPPESL